MGVFIREFLQGWILCTLVELEVVSFLCFAISGESLPVVQSRSNFLVVVSTLGRAALVPAVPWPDAIVSTRDLELSTAWQRRWRGSLIARLMICCKLLAGCWESSVQRNLGARLLTNW